MTNKLFPILAINILILIISPSANPEGFDLAQIQAQDSTGNWRTYTTTQNNSQQVLQAMKELRWRMPDSRIRAVDDNGRIIDIY